MQWDVDYEVGSNGYPVDQMTALEMIRCASKKGCAAANHLAKSYYPGEGADQDAKKAKYHCQIAAMMGDDY